MNSKVKSFFLVIQIKTGKNKHVQLLSGIFWLLPMMKPEMHRGGLALIFFCVCVGLGGRRVKGRVTFNIFFFLLLFFSSKKTLFFHHILH